MPNNLGNFFDLECELQLRSLVGLMQFMIGCLEICTRPMRSQVNELRNSEDIPSGYSRQLNR